MFRSCQYNAPYRPISECGLPIHASLHPYIYHTRLTQKDVNNERSKFSYGWGNILGRNDPLHDTIYQEQLGICTKTSRNARTQHEPHRMKRLQAPVQRQHPYTKPQKKEARRFTFNVKLGSINRETQSK